MINLQKFSTFSLFLIFGLLTNALALPHAGWQVRSQMKLPGKATVLAYSPDGSRIAVGHPNGEVSVWHVSSGESIKVLSAHTKEVNSLQFVKNGSQLFTMGDDHRAKFWSTSDWKEMTSI